MHIRLNQKYIISSPNDLTNRLVKRFLKSHVWPNLWSMMSCTEYVSLYVIMEKKLLPLITISFLMNQIHMNGYFVYLIGQIYNIFIKKEMKTNAWG